MSLVFVDGFDHYATADLQKKWTMAGSEATVLATAGRRGGGCLVMGNSSHALLQRNFQAGASWVIGFAFYYNDFGTFLSTGRRILAAWLNVSAVQCDLRMNLDSTLSVTRNGSALTGGTSTIALAANAWHYIEWRVTIADAIADNSCQVRVNGDVVINVAAGANTKADTGATANVLLLGGYFAFANAYYDDLYVCDSNGATNNDFLGDCRVDTLMPNADGVHSEFSPGAPHWPLVAEKPFNSSTYVSATTVGAKETYAFADLTPLTGLIYGVQVCNVVLKADSGTRAIASLARSSGVEATGPNRYLPSSTTISCTVLEKDPATNAAWLETGVNAAEFGVVISI